MITVHRLILFNNYIDLLDKSALLLTTEEVKLNKSQFFFSHKILQLCNKRRKLNHQPALEKRKIAPKLADERNGIVYTS